MYRIILLVFLSCVFSLEAQVKKRDFEQKWETDLTKSTINRNELVALLPRDRITPIDEPKYWNKVEASNYYYSHEPVMAFVADGKAKAYPLSVLMFHEIVNDQVGGVYFSATYCPLCNATLVFNRKLTYDGKEHLLDFGTSGMLRNSDLVMWDRQTETWWQQITGEGLVGELAGAQLEILPSQLISFNDFFKAYPEGEILAFPNPEGKYGENPYNKYDSSEKPFLFEGDIDERLPATARVVNVLDFETVYAYDYLSQQKVVNAEEDDIAYAIFFKPGMVSAVDEKEIKSSKAIGSVAVFDRKLDDIALDFEYDSGDIKDKNTGSTWDITGHAIAGPMKGKKLYPLAYGQHFAFAWFAFHPDSKLIDE
ncbi:MAG: DUF3179 domain-containing protein [Flavobacteriaceae bacterium]|nr:DUF3179 domain-containing protein [Flavobacteriaceae bacterium]